MATNQALAKTLLRNAGVQDAAQQDNIIKWLNRIGADNAFITQAGVIGKLVQLYSVREGARILGFNDKQILEFSDSTCLRSENLSCLCVLLQPKVAKGAQALKFTAEQILSCAKHWASDKVDDLAKLLQPEVAEGAKTLEFTAEQILSCAGNLRAIQVDDFVKLLQPEVAEGARTLMFTAEQILSCAGNLRAIQVDDFVKLLQPEVAEGARTLMFTAEQILSCAKHWASDKVDDLADKIKFVAGHLSTFKSNGLDKAALRAICLNTEINLQNLQDILAPAAQDKKPKGKCKKPAPNTPKKGE